MKRSWHGTAPEVAALFITLAIQINYDSPHGCTLSLWKKINSNHCLLNTDMALVCQEMFGNPFEHHILIMDKSLGNVTGN